jgi:hypothetical protein
MKTLARERDRNEILGRIRRLRADDVRRWGRMSAHEMVCHLNDSFCMMAGDKFVRRNTGALQAVFLKWFALYVPLPWPSGIVTSPELDPQLDGTRPIEFTADLARLTSLVEAAARSVRAAGWPVHPIFGSMSRRDWFRWAYLHTDHHLRQFGA